MEDNDVAIFLGAAVEGKIVAANTTSGNEVDYGIRISGATRVSIECCSLSATSGFTGSAIDFTGNGQLLFKNVSAASWNIGSVQSYQSEFCNDPALAVAALPGTPQPGEEHEVDDADTPVLGDTVTGGGATTCRVRRAPSAAWKVVLI
jgi:hypothetical protein